MVDSRAKNAFPSFLSGDKWCFLPYDMDTAIGIDNQGALTYGYSLEDIDKVGTENVFNGQNFKDYLKFCAKLPRYSVNNQLLIMMQKPDATMCQSYTGWKDMNRSVKRGEKGIRILAPAPYKMDKEQDKKDSFLISLGDLAEAILPIPILFVIFSESVLFSTEPIYFIFIC